MNGVINFLILYKMELFLNECSIPYIPNETLSARDRIIIFLKTAKALRPYGFNIIRAHNNFYTENLGEGYTPSSFLGDEVVSTTLKTLLQSIVRNPFIADTDSYEAEAFILNTFQIESDGITIQPEGLAAAYINESQTISFCGFGQWEQESLEVEMINSEKQIFIKNILNHAFETSINNIAFLAWLESNNSGILMNSLTNIELIFPPAQFQFEQRAVNDLISWFNDDIRFQIRIKQLIEDIAAHPFTGGLGHTEVLKGTGGRASKRIIGMDRLVYTYNNDRIVIHQCRGHYNDH